MAHRIKHLPHKHKDLSTVPRNPQNPGMEVHVCNLSTGEVEIRGSWGPLASQSSPTNELQV